MNAQTAPMREYVETLLEENRQLREIAFGPPSDNKLMKAQSIFGLSKSEALVFILLARREFCSKEHLYQGLYSSKIEQPSDQTIRVFVMRARRAAAKFGIEIDNVWGQGYRMPAASQAIAKRILETEEA